MRNYDDFYNAASGFVKACDNIFSVYLDSTIGFNNNVDSLQEMMNDVPSLTGLSPYGIQAPDEIERGLNLHNFTIDEFLKRNSISGFNYIKIGQFSLCVSSLIGKTFIAVRLDVR